jgi:hypothetical protein
MTGIWATAYQRPGNEMAAREIYQQSIFNDQNFVRLEIKGVVAAHTACGVS